MQRRTLHMASQAIGQHAVAKLADASAICALECIHTVATGPRGGIARQPGGRATEYSETYRARTNPFHGRLPWHTCLTHANHEPV